MQAQVEPHKQVSAAFVLSVVSGTLILLQGVLRLVRSQWGLELGLGEFRKHSLGGTDYKVIGALSIMVGVVVLVGAFLLKKPDRVRQGAITVVAFSALSIFAGGGFIAGLILGVIGGAFALSGNTEYANTQQNSA
ncbi:MAG: hypothetical protein NWF05_09700 [Candidatus Bathyarchaeota archaeon]|nr:hypothetical protein [Candidatus Bathyarchaeota archaeon]